MKSRPSVLSKDSITNRSVFFTQNTFAAPRQLTDLCFTTASDRPEATHAHAIRIGDEKPGKQSTSTHRQNPGKNLSRSITGSTSKAICITMFVDRALLPFLQRGELPLTLEPTP